MYNDLLVHMVHSAGDFEQLTDQAKEDLVVKTLYLSNKKLSLEKIFKEMNGIFGCKISMEEVNFIISGLIKRNRVLKNG